MRDQVSGGRLQVLYGEGRERVMESVNKGLVRDNEQVIVRPMLTSD